MHLADTVLLHLSPPLTSCLIVIPAPVYYNFHNATSVSGRFHSHIALGTEAVLKMPALFMSRLADSDRKSGVSAEA